MEWGSGFGSLGWEAGLGAVEELVAVGWSVGPGWER